MTKETIDQYKKILVGENEPSTMEWVGMVENLLAAVEELQAQNTRYVAALQRIIDYTDFAEDEYSDTVAAQALNPNPIKESGIGRAAKSHRYLGESPE